MVSEKCYVFLQEHFNHIFAFNEKIKKTVDQVKSQTESKDHFQVSKEFSISGHLVTEELQTIQRKRFSLQRYYLVSHYNRIYS